MNDLDGPNISYREATVSDCVAVARTHVESWRQSFVGIVPQTFLDKMSVENRSKAFEKRFSEDSYKMYVAEERGVIGFVDFGEPREIIDTYEAELFAIYLLPEFHRKGIGGRLFNLCIDNLVMNGKSSMYLFALEVSQYKSFYEKKGGKVVGRKQIEIESIMFDELVYGWNSLKQLSFTPWL
jgi:ribosomal protein S18 acetylase RimI-like enzyme